MELRNWNRRRVLGVFVVALAVLPLGVGAFGPQTGAVPSASAAATTTVTAPSSGPGKALLTGVQVQSSNGIDSVVFQFTGPSTPLVTVTDRTGPLLAISGQPVAIAGTAVLSVSFFPASAFDLGDPCLDAAPAVTPVPGQQVVGVAFTCKNPTGGPWPASRASRAVTASADPSVLLGEAVAELLGGPNVAEQQAGFSSPFTPATHGLLLSATIDAGGHAVLDFDPSLASVLAIPTSSDAQQILRSLDGTLAPFTTITGAEYRLGGSCTAFFAWLGQPCTPRTPTDLIDAAVAPTYTGPARVTGPTSNVTEAAAVSDFEATLVWGIGLRADVPVTVRSDPATFRVTIDIPRAPTPPPTTVAPVVGSPRFTG